MLGFMSTSLHTFTLTFPVRYSRSENGGPPIHWSTPKTLRENQITYTVFMLWSSPRQNNISFLCFFYPRWGIFSHIKKGYDHWCFIKGKKIFILLARLLVLYFYILGQSYKCNCKLDPNISVLNILISM